MARTKDRAPASGGSGLNDDIGEDKRLEMYRTQVVILGYLVFDHVPAAWTMAGAAVVIGSGLYLLYRERKLGKTTTSEGVVEGPLE